MIFFSFCLFLFLFTLVGSLSVLKKKNTSLDYLLANQEIKPWLAAISAIATIFAIVFTWMNKRKEAAAAANAIVEEGIQNT